MTFRRRILGFGCILGMLVLLCASVMVMGLMSLRQQYQLLRQVQVESKVQTLIIGKEVNFVSSLTRNIMLGSNLQIDQKSLEDTIERIEKAFQQLEKVAEDGQEKGLTAKARETTLAFVNDGRRRMLTLTDVPVEKRYLAFKEYEATERTLRAILGDIQDVVRASQQIETATQEQGRNSDEVARQVEDASKATERSAAASMELAQTVQEVVTADEEAARATEDLAAALARFKTH